MFRIKYNKIEKEKKFIKVKLNGVKLKVVAPPRIKGTKNIDKNLFFSRLFKKVLLLLVLLKINSPIKIKNITGTTSLPLIIMLWFLKSNNPLNIIIS